MADITTFYIADHQIDLSRSIVIKGDKQVQVEPKVLKVLLLLAQRQNEVVTHKEIMDLVWQGAEVVPNALQRCIAILRKVLNDDAKAPTIIATHPRIGYRLLAEVVWDKEPEELHSKIAKAEHDTENNSKRLGVALNVLAFAFILLISTAIYNVFWSNSVPNQYTRVNKLTETDAHETNAIFNPNAEYLIFNRYAGACKTHLWAQHLKSGQEYRLTKTPGNYGSTSFTQDGRELVFAANNECDSKPNTAKLATERSDCWGIATLDFAQSLSEPQQPNLRYQCQSDRVQTPKALSNHQYAFLQYLNGQHQLVIYDDLNKKTELVYTPLEGDIYHFDYESKSKQYVVFGRDNDFNNVLKILDENGNVLKKEMIELGSGMSQFQKIEGSFGPNNECLLAVANSKLYRVDYDGKLHTIVTPEVNLISAVRHPNSKELVAVEGGKDIDIALLSLDAPIQTVDNNDLNSVNLPFTSLSRTKKKERDAKFQPNGEQIAFISNRTGYDQLWLWKDGQAVQLKLATEHYAIRNFSWSSDGKQLAIITADKLIITDLQGNVAVIKSAKPLYSILAWYDENSFLVSLHGSDFNELYRLDAKTGELTSLGIAHVQEAWVVKNKLVYRNTNQKVYTRLLTGSGQGVELPVPPSRSIVVYEGSIFSVDDSSLMLNQYDLQGQFIQAVIPLKQNAWLITDIRNDQLLLSQFVAINHDIVLLK